MNLIKPSIVSLFVLFLVACSTTHGPALDELTTNNQTFAKDENFVVLITQRGDSLRSLAEMYLGDASRSWVIADFNGITEIVPQREIVIPLKPQNSTGIYSNGYQTIPILVYHRFGDGHEKMAVSAESFRTQMRYLKDNGYHVIALKDIYQFIESMESLPKKTVVITIDDGYRSTYEIAYPILKEFNFPATIFLYTDFMGANDALNWQQNEQMAESGLIDFQPHSRSHPNMALAEIGESKLAYKKRIINEIEIPSKKISQFIKNPLHTFAYPYGDTNQFIIKHLRKLKYKMGVTVQPGGNPTFAHPYMLHRTMVFGNHDMNKFARSLAVFRKVDLK